MTVELNHTIVWCRDQKKSAKFLAEILGRPKPERFAHFDVVQLDNGVSMDFSGGHEEIARQHYAFLISEKEFDEVFARIKEREIAYWADPAKTKPGKINRHDGGRGMYFHDPDGHFLEVITRPYVSGG
jgi:catechol 2,3-dioxygenase-like lactoylglutathione lyase family enzyme